APTPGQSSLQVGKPGTDAIRPGASNHSRLQGRYPQLGMLADYGSRQAGVTRGELFGKVCDTSTLMCTAHFPSPSSGRVVRHGDGFAFAQACACCTTIRPALRPPRAPTRR